MGRSPLNPPIPALAIGIGSLPMVTAGETVGENSRLPLPAKHLGWLPYHPDTIT